jgi:hypothetical protein
MRTGAINRFASCELCRSLQDGGKTPLTVLQQSDVRVSFGRSAIKLFERYSLAIADKSSDERGKAIKFRLRVAAGDFG